MPGFSNKDDNKLIPSMVRPFDKLMTQDERNEHLPFVLSLQHRHLRWSSKDLFCLSLSFSVIQWLAFRFFHFLIPQAIGGIAVPAPFQPVEQ